MEHVHLKSICKAFALPPSAWGCCTQNVHCVLPRFEMREGVPAESTADLLVPDLRQPVRHSLHPDSPDWIKAPHEVPGVYSILRALLVRLCCWTWSQWVLVNLPRMFMSVIPCPRTFKDTSPEASPFMCSCQWPDQGPPFLRTPLLTPPSTSCQYSMTKDHPTLRTPLLKPSPSCLHQWPPNQGPLPLRTPLLKPPP